ncbi:MAG TPA: hypothetical protein VI796_01040, partial [Candidatus Thermoplasmatota archaeon]|nr:hypothetical protein [Candidatus Thermoplasmatota archaeon]
PSSLRLADRLLADRAVTVRGNRIGRWLGIVVAAAGLTLVLADLRDLDTGGAGYEITGTTVTLTFAGAGISAVGLALTALFVFVPTTRRLGVWLAASQREEWDRIQGEVRRSRAMAMAGWPLVGLGAGALVAAYAVDLPFTTGVALAAGGVLLGAGALLLAAAAARQSLLHRLYVQTLILSSLEAHGLGAGGDARVGPVLQALDRLLGSLPEAAVRQFLSSEQAEHYLQLLEELAAEGRDGR